MGILIQGIAATSLLADLYRNTAEKASGAVQFVSDIPKVDPNLLNPLSYKWNKNGTTHNNAWVRLSTKPLKEVNTADVNEIIRTVTSQAVASWKDIVSNYKGFADANTGAAGVIYDDYLFYDCKFDIQIKNRISSLEIPNYRTLKYSNGYPEKEVQVRFIVPPIFSGLQPDIDTVRAIKYLYELNRPMYIQSPQLESVFLSEDDQVIFDNTSLTYNLIEDNVYMVSFSLIAYPKRPIFKKYIE